MRKAFEAYFHTSEDVTRYIEEAAQIVTAADVPDAVAVTAFAKAVDLLAQKQVTFEQVTPSGVLLNNRPQG